MGVDPEALDLVVPRDTLAFVGHNGVDASFGDFRLDAGSPVGNIQVPDKCFQSDIRCALFLAGDMMETYNMLFYQYFWHHCASVI